MHVARLTRCLDLNEYGAAITLRTMSVNPILTVQGGGAKTPALLFFGNISSTEARIFMKFQTYVHKIVVDHQPNFHKDLCKDARA